MPLFRRSDGDLVPNLDPIRRMMPLIMPGRNQSVVYHTTRWDIARARIWLRNYNRNRGERARASFFHLVLYASARTMHERPGLNRFVAGGRIYQRRGVFLSFAMKTRFEEDAPLTTAKLAFAEDLSFEDCVKMVTDAIENGRSGRPNAIEREVRFLTRLPMPLLRVVVGAGKVLDRWNLLPSSMIKPDPMFSSMFLANLGSIHIDNAFHHLYEYGTCSLFGVISRPSRLLQADRSDRAAVREVLQVQWTFDERINDGFYCLESLQTLQRIVEDPQRYVVCKTECAAGAEERAGLTRSLS
ncbi:MAG: 2-oxo acid dehydrogenase subunit E2 [Terracidiphilus sp.]|nr:2-oxo acid dehydrogenase subunit E2 [Terracidiphilus sp.]